MYLYTYGYERDRGILEGREGRWGEERTYFCAGVYRAKTKGKKQSLKTKDEPASARSFYRSGL